MTIERVRERALDVLRELSDCTAAEQEAILRDALQMAISQGRLEAEDRRRFQRAQAGGRGD